MKLRCSTRSSSRKKRRKNNQIDVSDNNNSIDVSVGARELFLNGYNHASYHRGKYFIPIKYQTMIEVSACSGYDLAIGYCHLHGCGDFLQDQKKGYNIINKYNINSVIKYFQSYLI